MKNLFFQNFRLSVFFMIFFTLASLLFGCGGGGGSSSTTTDTIGPIVATIEGKIFVPVSVSAAPGQRSPEPAGPGTFEVGTSSENSLLSNPSRAITINPREGYVPLSGANVTLSGTNKAVVTDASGYFKFEIGQFELPKTETKKITVSKPDSNVNIEFDVRVTAGENKYIATEVDTRTGEKAIKEILTNKQQSPFVYVSGRIMSSAGAVVSNAIVDITDETTLAKITPNVIPYPVTDAFGRYEITGLIDGHTYTVTSLKENFKPYSKSIIVSSNYTLSNIDFIIPGTFNVSKRTFKPGITDIKISYTTSVPSTYTMYYGTTQEYKYTYTPSSATYSKSTDIILSNLSPKTVYNYKLTIVDQFGNAITTDNETFETLDPAATSTVAPTINPNYTVVKTHKSITVNFSTNTSAYGQVKYTTGTLAPSYSVELGPQTNFNVTLDNLLNNTTYKLNLIARNMVNKDNYTDEPKSPSTITVTTDNSPDRNYPLISAITVSDIKAKEATISWDAADSHENIINNTDATIYFDTFSYPILEYDILSDPIQPKLKDRYGSATTTQSFTRNTRKTITLSGLQYSTKYYFRPASVDPSGNAGTSTSETQFSNILYYNSGTSGEGAFTTASPGTALTFSLDESPAKGQISVGEDAKILRMKLTGSTEENLVLNKIVFSQTGNISYNSMDKFEVSDGINKWTVTKPTSSSIEVLFTNPSLSIPKNNSIYLTANVALNSAALSTTNDTKSVIIAVAPNTKTATVIDVTGDVYGDYIKTIDSTTGKDKIAGVPIQSASQDINIGQLKLTAASTDVSSSDYQSSTQTVLVNKGMQDVTMFKFKVEAQYEDIDITQIQLVQSGTATEDDFELIRLYDGINSIGVGAVSGNNIIFQSNTSLTKITKGSTSDKTKIISVVGSIRPNAINSRYLQMKIDTINIVGLGNFSKQKIKIIGANDQTTGNSALVGSKYMIGDNALLIALATDSPTKQVFKLSETNKTFTIFNITAGSAEEIQIDTIELTFNGTASFSNSAFYITDENNTVIYQTADVAPLINATTKKLTIAPQSSFIITRGTTRKIFVKGNISSASSEVGKTIQIGLSTEGAVLGHGVQTAEKKSSAGTAIPSEPHSIVGTVVLAPDLPQPSFDLLAGSAQNNFIKFKITPSGETLEVQSFTFNFVGSYSILDKLKVIDPSKIDPATGKSAEVAVNPTISGSSVIFTPTVTTSVPPSGMLFWLVGDISSSANSSNSMQFTIPSSGISIKGQASGQTYKTQEIITGNNLKIVGEAFYLSSTPSLSNISSITIGDPATQEVFAFRFEAKPRTSYYISKITLRQTGSATFGAGQDVTETDFDFYTESTLKNAQIKISGSDINITFASTTDVLIDATSQSSLSSYLNCYLKCKTQKTAVKGKTLQFYVDNQLVTANSTTLKTQLSGTGSVTGNSITLKDGGVSAQTYASTPASASILNANLIPFFSFLLTSEVEALEVRQINLNLSVINGQPTDFDPSSLVIDVFDSAGAAVLPAYQGGNVTVSGNTYSVVPSSGGVYLSIPKDSFIRIQVSGKANFAAAQTGSQMAFRIAAAGDITTVGTVSGHTIYSTGTVSGNYMTVQKSLSTVTVAARTDTPPAQILTLPASTKQLFTFDLTTNNVENLNVTKMIVTFDDSTSTLNTGSLVTTSDNNGSNTVLAGPGIVGNTLTYGNGVATLFTIQKNSSAKITISGQISGVAAAGNQFRLKVMTDGDITAVGQTSASTIASTGTTAGNVMTVTSLASAPTPTLSAAASAAVSGYPNSQKITWTTNTFSDSKVQYGTTDGGPYPFTLTDSASTLSHSMIINGLTTGVTYYYVVSSTDSRGNINSLTNPAQKFTLTSLKKGYLDAVFQAPAATDPTIIPPGTRFLVRKIDLKNFKDSTYGDGARITSVTFDYSASIFPLASITKFELTDGVLPPFTVNNPSSNTIKFDNMNYVVPEPSTAGALPVTTATLSLYATINSSTASTDYNETIVLGITPKTHIIARGALYNSDINADAGAFPSSAALTTGPQTVDAGQLIASDDAATNGAAASNASPGDLNVLLMGFNLKTARTGDTGAAAKCPEDITLKTIKVSNAGTGSLSTDISNVKLYDENNNLLGNGVYNSGNYEFSSALLYTMPKGDTVTKNFKVYADIPQNATLGKTIKLKLLSTDITATNANSNTNSISPVTPPPATVTVTGREHLVGKNDLTVTLDATSPTAATFYPDGTERLISIFTVKTGAAEGVTLGGAAAGLESNFTRTGTMPQANISSVRLFDGTAFHTLSTLNGFPYYATKDAIALNANTTYKFSIYATITSAPAVAGGTTLGFKMNDTSDVPNFRLTGKGSSSLRTINSANGVPTPDSPYKTVIGKLTLADSATSPTGNILIGNTGGGSGVSLFAFSMTPAGENSKIDSIKILMNNGSLTNDIDNTITNLKLYDALPPAAPVATATSVSGNYITFSNLSGVAPFNNMIDGVTKTLTLYGNVRTASTSGSSVSFKIETPSTDVVSTGQASLQTLLVTGSAAGNTLTTATGSLSVGPSDKIGIGGTATTDTKEIKLGDKSDGMLVIPIKITPGSAEDVKITEIKLNVEGFDLTTDFGIPPAYWMWRDNPPAVSDLTAAGINLSGVTITPTGGSLVTFTKASGITTITAGITTCLVIGVQPGSPANGRSGKFVIKGTPVGSIKGLGATSGKEFYSTGSVNDGTGTMQKVVTGILSASLDPSSVSQTLLKGQSGITIAKFRLSSALSSTGGIIEDINLNKVKIYTSADTSNFSAAPQIKIGGSGLIARSGISSDTNTHVYDFSMVSVPGATGATNQANNLKMTFTKKLTNAGSPYNEIASGAITGNFTGTGVTITSATYTDSAGGGPFVTFVLAGATNGATIVANNTLLEASTGNNITAFAYYNTAATMWYNTPLLTKDAAASDIQFITGISQTANTNSLSASLIASGTQGKGFTSAQTITCSSGDQPGPSHTIGSIGFTASISAADNPLSQYAVFTKDDMSATADSARMIGISMSVDNTENLNFTNMVIKYEGNVNASSIKSLYIKNSSDTDLTVAGGKLNPFASSGSICTVVPADFIGGVAPTFTKGTTTSWRIYLGLNPTSSITDGSSIKLSIANAGITASGASTSQTVTSTNAVSNTMFLQKAILNFTASSYAAGNFQPGDTGKTVFQFTATPGTYQDIAAINLRIPIAGSHNADLYTELTNYKLYADGKLCAATITPVGGAPGTSLLITPNPTITITKGTAKTFALTADIASTAVSGKFINFKTDGTLLYVPATDFSPLIYSPNLAGSATGNQHKITRYASLTIANSSYTPDSTNLTLNVIDNITTGPSADTNCNKGRIGIFELTAGTQSNINITKIKLNYQGSAMSDIKTPAPPPPAIPASPNYGMGIRISSSILTLDSGAPLFTISNFDAVNKTIEFTIDTVAFPAYVGPPAGYLLTKDTKYYVGVYAQINSNASIGHFTKVNITATNTTQSDPVNAPFTASAATTSEDIKYDGVATSNSIYIDSPEVSVVVRSSELSDVLLDLPYNIAITDRKVMQIDISNSNFTAYQLYKVDIDMGMYSSAVALLNNNVTATLKLYELQTTQPNESLVAQVGPTNLNIATVNSDMVPVTFSLLPASMSFTKGQTRKFAVKLSTNKSLYSAINNVPANPNYGGGAFSNTWLTGCFPYITFAVNQTAGNGIMGYYPNLTTPTGVVKGRDYIRIPADSTKKFFFRSAQ